MVYSFRCMALVLNSFDSKMDKGNEIYNLLYRNPELYEKVYPNLGDRLPRMCRQIFERYLKHYPTSILDIGCGTGRDLQALSLNCSDCVGVDFLPEMIRYAKSKYPQLEFLHADMRTLRLERTFEAIISLGWVLHYALTNEDINKTLETFATHAEKGSILILEILNGARYLTESGFREPSKFTFTSENETIRADATYHFLRREQILVRKRVWQIPGQESVEDYCKYRLFFPAELDRLLAAKGFKVVDMFDNRDLQQSDLSGRLLYVVAIFE